MGATGCLVGLVHHFGKWTDSNNFTPVFYGCGLNDLPHHFLEQHVATFRNWKFAELLFQNSGVT